MVKHELVGVSGIHVNQLRQIIRKEAGFMRLVLYTNCAHRLPRDKTLGTEVGPKVQIDYGPSNYNKVEF